MRIGLIQMRCEKGALSENLDSISHYLEEVSSRHIDIVAFPEMSLTGYVDPKKWPRNLLQKAVCDVTIVP